MVCMNDFLAEQMPAVREYLDGLVVRLPPRRRPLCHSSFCVSPRSHCLFFVQALGEQLGESAAAGVSARPVSFSTVEGHAAGSGTTRDERVLVRALALYGLPVLQELARSQQLIVYEVRFRGFFIEVSKCFVCEGIIFLLCRFAVETRTMAGHRARKVCGQLTS